MSTKEYHATREVAALAEVVYNTAGDLDRLRRWLPAGVTAEHLEDGLVLVRWRLGGRQGETRCALSTDDERLRVEWRAQDVPEVGGWLEVGQAGAGASRVEVCVTAPADVHATVESLTESALTHLQEEVDENFTAG
ncbi:SRPBCC family protein [Nonomuraea sp. NPDC050383]|uniref:SRPBCC family protein n=1 Tax=Nonomuraea sp. NPDC050383 TaxID=3364362 RepID=UPI0037B45B69